MTPPPSEHRSSTPSKSITGNILAVSSGDSNVTLWKEALDGSWSQVSRVEDVAATGGKGAD
jgi:hypothetical protein